MGKPLSSLTHEDLLAYERFLADPQPAARWVLTGNKKLARNHPDWRPFAGPLSPGSVRQAMVILNALFAWLTEAGYLAGNPLALARRRRAPAQARITRYLSHGLWETVKDTVAAMPAETARERLHAARCRWVLTVLYLGGAVLASASAHWLRHTAGSHMTDQQVDLRFVRDNFGHSSLSTTSGYLHSEEDARHEATQERHRIGWGMEK
ncbi:Tyrosine recombinase XerC [compost metagenome]